MAIVMDISSIEMVARIFISVVLGALIGFEREVSHKAAGLRTHMLVCLGSAIFTIMSIEFIDSPSRIIAGFVTGIGFIGAGSIIALRGHLQGITTAATLWVTASIGLGIGAGEYLLATVGALAVFGVLQIKGLEGLVPRNRKSKDDL